MLAIWRQIVARFTREPQHPQAPRVHAPARTMAGTVITPDTAVTVAAVWACLRYLSQTVAVLPWHVMKDGKLGAEIQSTHSIDWLLHKRPNPEWSSFQFRETLTHWALRWGNGYAEIEPDQLGRPFALWPIHPERVECCRSDKPGVSSYGDEIAPGELFYEVNNGVSEKTIIAAKRMIHIRGFGEGPVGVSVIHYAAQSIGWARAAQLFGASFFGNGAHVAGIVTNKNPLSAEAWAKQKAEVDELHKGPRHAHRTVVLDNDADWKQVGLDAEKSQLIEVHQFLVEEICRWFGVPPHKVMHLLRATFSNIEHQAIEVVVDSVSPWVKRFEDEADYKLFGQNRSGLYTRMNMRALMRGDAKTRGEYYQLMRNVGAYSVNRILELEDENTIGTDGDKRVMQSQYTTLERIGEEPVEPQGAAGDAGNDSAMREDDEVAAARARAEAMLEPV